MKKVLIHTTDYQNLYKIVVTELENQGWEVKVVIDRMFSGDPKFNFSHLTKVIKQYVKFGKYRNWQPQAEQFWGGITLSIRALRFIYMPKCFIFAHINT